MTTDPEPAWPVDLGAVRLWQMESEDGPLLQELFDDLADFRTPFGEPGAADAVSTFVALPEGRDYDAKLLVGIWQNGGLAGALDCIMSYPSPTDWTIGLLVIADRHRRTGIATAVLDWLETSALNQGATAVRAVLREGNYIEIAFAAARGYKPDARPPSDPGFVVLTRSLSAS